MDHTELPANTPHLPVGDFRRPPPPPGSVPFVDCWIRPCEHCVLVKVGHCEISWVRLCCLTKTANDSVKTLQHERANSRRHKCSALPRPPSNIRHAVRGILACCEIWGLPPPKNILCCHSHILSHPYLIPLSFSSQLPFTRLLSWSSLRVFYRLITSCRRD